MHPPTTVSIDKCLSVIELPLNEMRMEGIPQSDDARAAQALQDRHDVALHIEDGPFHRAFPRQAGIFWLAMGVEDAATGGDDRAAAVGKCGLGHLGGCALGAVTGEEEDRLGEALADAGDGVFLGCADDSADGAVAAIAD